MASVDFKDLGEVSGFIGACLVDSNSGMVLWSKGSNLVNLDIAAAGNTTLIRNKRKTIQALEMTDRIEDILITLENQYHLIRPLVHEENYFIYLVLDRKEANLGIARWELAEFEKNLILK